MVGAMLRSHLELTADVLFNKTAKECIALIRKHIIISNARTDKHLFYAGYTLHTLQQLDIFAVIGDEVRARSRRKAAAIRADTVLELPLACGTAEICRRTSDVVNIALEIRELCQQLRFADNAVNTARSHRSALMVGNGAESTAAEAAAIMRDGEAHLANSGNAALRLIARMICPLIRQCVNAVQLLALERGHRRILHKDAVAVALGYRPAAYVVVLTVLSCKRLCIQRTVGTQLIYAPSAYRLIMQPLVRRSKINGTAQITYLGYRNASVEQLCESYHDVLAHSVGQQIRSGIDKDAVAHTVVPVIIMGTSAKRCLKSADDYRHIAVRLADAIAVYDYGAVGAQSGLSAGRIVVVAAAALCDGIVCDHRIEISR